MNWEHLKAFVWLRRRIAANQWRRAGTLNAVLMTIISVGAVVLSIPLFIGTLALGIYGIPRAEPIHLLYIADVLIVGFLFSWTLGVVAEMQKTEVLSLSKFLHLPVSVGGAFLINFVSSLMGFSLVSFAPILLGLALALVFTKGPLLLLAFPLMAAFVFMVTALTYQLQGWLASLMSNPRRRRTVVVVTTVGFMLLLQMPNLLNFFAPWSVFQQQTKPSTEMAKEFAELTRAYNTQEIDAAEYMRRQEELTHKYKFIAQQNEIASLKSVEAPTLLLNRVLPVGWLPLGIMAASEGRALPAVLGCLGMTLIGSASLWRAYHTTLGLYQGKFAGGNTQSAPRAERSTVVRKAGIDFLERRLVGVSEPVAAIALGGLRSLFRSPESKLMLLLPLALGAVFGATLVKASLNIPINFRPLVAIGGMVIVLFGVMQFLANQFGFDRDGFRVFVLCAASRRDILLGKNLAFAPLVAGMAAIFLIIAQVVSPMRLDHLLAMLPQFTTMYLLFCLLMNLLSIYTPMQVAQGTMKPANQKLIPVLAQLTAIGIVFPLLQIPTFFPLGIEAGLVHLGWNARLPICLVLTLAECAVVVVIYRYVLAWQGKLLHSREQAILEVVTNRAP